jgi:hypothetical protein
MLLAARRTDDVCHVEKAPAEACDALFVAAADLGDEEGWVHVGRGGCPGHEPLPLLRQGALERSLAFKRWARGRCFRCLQRGHQVSSCRKPFRCLERGHQVIGSVSVVRAFRPLVLALQILMLLASGAALRPLSLVVPRRPGVGLRSCATRLCVQRCCQDPLLGVVRSSVSAPVWTLSFSQRLP